MNGPTDRLTRETESLHRPQPRGTGKLWYREEAVRMVNPDPEPIEEEQAAGRSLGPYSQVLSERIALAKRRSASNAAAATPSATAPLRLVDNKPRGAGDLLVVDFAAESSARSRQTSTLPRQTSTLSRPATTRLAPSGTIRAEDGWRTVPEHAPNLFISESRVLDRPLEGAMLGPGVLYRISNVQNGVAEVEIAQEGTVTTGYCAAVDLMCFDRRVTANGSTVKADIGPAKAGVTGLLGRLRPR